MAVLTRMWDMLLSPCMGDWLLTKFNDRLTEGAYANSFDYPSAAQKAREEKFSRLKGAAWPKIAPDIAARRQAGAHPPREPKPWYWGPRRLAPENMGNVELFFHESPGSRIERVLRPVFCICILVTLVCALALFIVLASPGQNENRADADNSSKHPGQIGILNPQWVEEKSYLRMDREMPSDNYLHADGHVHEMTFLPPKFLYESPDDAQKDLERLIEDGLVTAQGAAPDVVRDFEKLKALGITSN